MLDLCAGFVYSQVLFTCVRLRLFDILFKEPLTIAALAERLLLSPEATSRLLDAAVSLGLVERRGRSVYGLGQLGAALAGNPAALSLIEHQPLLYADLEDPVALLRGSLRGTGIARYWPYSAAVRPTELTAEDVAPYSALMAASQPIIAQEVLDSYPIHRHRCLLDVGGGEGVFLAAAAARAPALRLMLFDLPAVAERARNRLADAGLLERASIYGGNFMTDPLPEGADIISLIRIVHDHDDASALSLLRAVHRALPPQRHAPHRGGDVGRLGRRTARRLLWILHPRHGPRRAENRRGDQQLAEASRLQPLSSSAQPNAHPNQHPRRPADFELRIGFAMSARVTRTASNRLESIFRAAVFAKSGFLFTRLS